MSNEIAEKIIKNIVILMFIYDRVRKVITMFNLHYEELHI